MTLYIRYLLYSLILLLHIMNTDFILLTAHAPIPTVITTLALLPFEALTTSLSFLPLKIQLK